MNVMLKTITKEMSQYGVELVNELEWLTDCLRGTVKSGRFSITIWSFISVGWKGVGPIRVIEGRVNAEKYKNILKDVWPEIAKTFGKNIVFQDDNASIHRSRTVKQWKDRK